MSRDLLGNLQSSLTGMRNTYLVEGTFVEDILGGQPKTEELMRKFVESKLNREAAEAERKGLQPPSEERRAELVKRHLERMFGADSVDETINEESDRAWTTFFCDELGPWMGVYQVNAGVREMLSCLGITMSKRGSKQTFQHLLNIKSCDENGVEHEGDRGLRIHFYRNGEIVSQVDDYITKTASVSTPQGRRSIIKNHDRVLHATFRLLIHVPANLPKSRSTAVLRDPEIAAIFAHLQADGLGCSRSQGHGTFVVNRLERLTNVPWLQGGSPPDKLLAAK